MTREANPNVLDRDSARETVASAASETADVLRDIVNEGTWLLGRIVQTTGAAATPRPAHVALTLLLRHTLSLADAIDELFRAACFQPAMLQARAVMEAHMQMLFIAGQRSPHMRNPLGLRDFDPEPRDGAGVPLAGSALWEEQDRRGSAYWVAEVRRQLQVAKDLESAATEDRFERLLGVRMVPAGIADPEVQAELPAAVASWKAILQEPQNARASAEFDRVRGSKPYDPKWYSLWGPASVHALARSVGMAFQYESFYARGSRAMHGADPIGQLGPKRASGGRSVSALRMAEGMDDLVTTTVIQMGLAYRTTAIAIRPEEEPTVMSWIRRWLPALR